VSDVIPFERYRGGHVLTLPVLIGGEFPSRFMLDTGAGVTVLASDLATRAAIRPGAESYAGRRMSGQTVSTPLTVVPRISVGSFERRDVVAGVFDLSGFFPRDTGVEGILAASFFEPWPYAVNSVTRTIRVERGEPGPDRPRVPVEAPVFLRRDGPSVELFLDLLLPSGRVVRAEVDTGSDTLILHSRFMQELGVDTERAGVTVREGQDETGHAYRRYFAQLQGRVAVAAAPTIGQVNPRVMFQEIIYDGLVGDDFLRSFEVTYDLARSRLLFSPPA
jgi:hypothetical protein